MRQGAKFVAGLLLGISVTSEQVLADHIPFDVGDIYVAVGNGLIQHRDSAGNLLESLDTLQGGFTTGMAFDTAGNLYVTNFSAGNVSKFDTQGELIGTFGSGYSGSPESILFDGLGDVYVGTVNGDNDIRKFDALGNPLAQFNVATENRGSDFIELAADQCTMLYTSEGQNVKRFDVCSNVQLADFNVAPLPASASFALRLLPSGGLVVANNTVIARLDAFGNLTQTYDASGENCWFSLNLDPDSTSFWSADFCSSNVYKFDIESGDELLSFNTGTGFSTVFGLAVFAPRPHFVLSPVDGPIHICTNPDVTDPDFPSDCPFAADTWEFWQHKTGFHRPLGGIAGSDDTFAWDVNLNGEPTDRGKPVFAVAPGKVVKYGGDVAPGGCSASVLIEHNLNGDVWWSGYLHMKIDPKIKVDFGVNESTILGTISDTFCKDKINNHLHFIVYTGENTSGGLKSFDVLISESPDTTPPAVKVKKPNGGRIKAGTSFTISWESSDNVVIDSHDIELSTDGGATFPIVIASGLSRETQTYEWPVPPAINTITGRIRVVAQDATGNLGKDISNRNIRIK